MTGSTDYDFYLDHVLAERRHSIGTAASLRSYDHLRLVRVSHRPQGAFYEFIPAVPEPTSLPLLALGTLSLGCRNRR